MLKFIVLLFALVSLAGCNTFSVKDVADHTGVKNQRAGVAMLSSSEKTVLPPFLKEHIDKQPNASDSSDKSDLELAMERFCTEVKPESFVGEIPSLAAAAGKYLFEQWMESRKEALEELKKIAVRSYSETGIISGSKFKQMTCALVYRYEEDTKDIGFIALLELNNFIQGMTFTPRFVQASNALAVAKKTKDGSAPEITTAFAIAVRAIGAKLNGLPEVDTFGQGAASVGSISLKSGAKYQCNENCESSEVIPYLPDNKALVSITFSVTEIGDVGFNIDKSIGRINALKEALGSAIKEDIATAAKDQ